MIQINQWENIKNETVCNLNTEFRNVLNNSIVPDGFNMNTLNDDHRVDHPSRLHDINNSIKTLRDFHKNDI